ncbi:MAG TPA: NUDIX hydrolase [Candidatus Paceibacterota bacterium]|nr:NUDIX hydrolase [Candidatus Paceibacterota bacterium]
MKPLAVFNDNHFEPVDYVDRPTVKAVILNNKDEVLLFSGRLPGGGVERGETGEVALARECMEEIGATLHIDIEEMLGTVIQYRDLPKLKYIVHGYLYSLASAAVPTTTLENEIGKIAVWENVLMQLRVSKAKSRPFAQTEKIFIKMKASAIKPASSIAKPQSYF